MYVSPAGPVGAAATQASKPIRQMAPQAPPTRASSPRLQVSPKGKGTVFVTTWAIL